MNQTPIRHLLSIISGENVPTAHDSVKHKPKVRVNQGLKSEVAESAVCWQWGGGLWSAHTNRHIQRAVNFIISPPLTTPPHHRSLTPHAEFTLSSQAATTLYSHPVSQPALNTLGWNQQRSKCKEKKHQTTNAKKPKYTTPEKHLQPQTEISQQVKKSVRSQM